MSNRFRSIVIAAAVGAFGLAQQSSAAVIINEVYPGGGSSKAGTTYTRDFIELYNTGSAAQDLTGYKLQYFSAAGTTPNAVFNFGAGSSISAGDYITIVTGGAGSAGTALIGTGPDGTNGTAGGVGLSATAGAVQLVDPSAVVVDLVGYGATSTHSETAPATFSDSTNTNSISRTNFADTNNNQADFTQSTPPTPNTGTSSTVVAAPTPEPVSMGAFAVIGLMALNRRRRQ